MSKIYYMETPLFFEGGQHQLFGIVHRPDDSMPQNGIVLCHAYGEEKLWSHRVYVNLAREAVKRGIAAFRFDFHGHGDSSGDSSENTLDGFMADLDAAIAKFRETCPSVENIGLVGLRLGGTLAALYSERNANMQRLVLWEPVVDGAQYMQELLRINLSTQLAVFGSVQKNREALVEEMRAGVCANVDGYLIKSDFFDECSAVKLANVQPASSGARALVVQIAPNVKQKDREELLELVRTTPSIEFLKVEEPPFWREIKPFTSRTKELIDKTLDWWEQ